MSLFVAQGGISETQDYLRQTIAAAPSFQTWVGATTLVQALNRVHHFAIPPPSKRVYTKSELESLRPCVEIWTEPGYRGSRDSVEAGFHYKHNGVLMARFLQDVPNRVQDNPPAQDFLFQNILGQIMDDMEDLAGSGNPYLNIEEWEIVEGPYLQAYEAKQEQGEEQGYDVRFTWGNS